MKVLIEETREVKEINISDAKTGLDWSADFVGNNSNYSYEYSEINDEELPVMSEEDYEWWIEVTGKYQDADEAILKYEQTLRDENIIEFRDLRDRKCACDLEDMPDAMMSSIIEHKVYLAVEKADEGLCVEIASGVYLHSKGSMIEEVKDWSDEDQSKDVDFASAPYWITTDDGQNPIAIYNEGEIVEHID